LIRGINREAGSDKLPSPRNPPPFLAGSTERGSSPESLKVNVEEKSLN
jgi:hypothetical protein